MGLSGATSASFQYDGLGLRRSKAIGGTTTNFLYDGVNLVQEVAGGAPTANVLTGLGVDEVFRRTDGASGHDFLVDALGSPLELTDASGAFQTHYTYEPFGATRPTGATSTNAMQFTGRENDDIGLYYYRARYYSPEQQRFLSEDPIEFEGGTANLYEFVADNPVNLVDPLGTQIAIPWSLPLPMPPIGMGGLIEMSDAALIDLLTRLGRRTIPKPRRPGGGCCTCIARADADDTMPGNVQAGVPLFAFGIATARNCSEALKEAKRDASHRLGMKPKHIQWKCSE
jgi:RHS repeat-associated protein